MKCLTDHGLFHPQILNSIFPLASAGGACSGEDSDATQMGTQREFLEIESDNDGELVMVL